MPGPNLNTATVLLHYCLFVAKDRDPYRSGTTSAAIFAFNVLLKGTETLVKELRKFI